MLIEIGAYYMFVCLFFFVVVLSHFIAAAIKGEFTGPILSILVIVRSFGSLQLNSMRILIVFCILLAVVSAAPRRNPGPDRFDGGSSANASADAKAIANGAGRGGDAANANAASNAVANGAGRGGGANASANSQAVAESTNRSGGAANANASSSAIVSGNRGGSANANSSASATAQGK